MAKCATVLPLRLRKWQCGREDDDTGADRCAAPPYPPNPGPHRPPAPHAAVPEVYGAGRVVARRGAVEGRRGPAPEAGTPPGPAPFWVGTTVGLGGGVEPIRAVSLRPLPDTLAASCWCRSLRGPCPVWRSRAGGGTPLCRSARTASGGNPSEELRQEGEADHRDPAPAKVCFKAGYFCKKGKKEKTALNLWRVAHCCRTRCSFPAGVLGLLGMACCLLKA
ncbi:uncharacterized protein LOC132357137 [Balaenoptera ricei]|uniref:uncharacterized protein LOC132357137 n=1 Tax=Balaenoptera ricei TaxID=2746895 RepID=UPI0028BE0B97|nr:uncharacterized protein LOC132357137 [Balaenoptera ricei]